MYAKLFKSIYQGTLRGKSHGLLVFTNLLAHADQEGWVDTHPKSIADEVGLTLEQVQEALNELEAPDTESRSPEEDGRRIVRLDEHRAWGWRIVNHAKYRAIRNEEDRREQNRLAQAKWRMKNADSKQSKPSISTHKHASAESAHTDTEADTEADTKKESTRSRAASRPECVSSQTWCDWIALRKAKRAPVTATVIADAQSEANKAGMPLESFLREWCSRGSQGLKAEWLTKRNGSSHSGNGETAWQRSQRERVAEMTGGLVSRKPPKDTEVIDAEPTTNRLG